MEISRKKLENIIDQEGEMPISLYFSENKKGKIIISLNNGFIPDRKILLSCKDALNRLLDVDNNDVQKYNAEIDRLWNEQEKHYEPIKRPKQAGYVYLLKSNNKYKIGRSKNVNGRINSYKTQNPFGIEIICSKFVEDYIESEKTLLSLFYKNKVEKTTEWFSLDDNELFLINTVLASLK